MSDSAPTLCRILFIDIVGFSKKPSHDQKELILKLTDLVRQTPAISTLEKANRVELPTGDGIALALWGSAQLPLQAALELAARIKEYNHTAPPSLQIEVRTGINSGEVFTMADINQNRNIVGEGINNTQRVMDFGNTGHILSSKRLADEILAENPEYAPLLHDAGLFADKHGLEHHIFNVFNYELGNPETPTRNRTNNQGQVQDHFWKKLLDLMHNEGQFLRHPNLEPAHLFLALTKSADSLTVATLQDQGIDPTFARRELRRLLGKKDAGNVRGYSKNLQKVLANAWELAASESSDIGEAHLIRALFATEEAANVPPLLTQIGIDPNSLLKPFASFDPFASCVIAPPALGNSVQKPEPAVAKSVDYRDLADYASDSGSEVPQQAMVTQPLANNLNATKANLLRVSLIVKNGAQQGRVFNFSEPELFIVGRSPQANFVLDQNDSCVSRRHFMIEIVPPRCYIKDFASLNGTFVNDQRCQEAELKDGDIITAGQTSFLVKIAAEAADLPECKRCGDRFHPKSDGKPDSTMCPACHKEIELENADQFARTKVPVRAFCCECQIDLSNQAGSDGLGLQLAKVATYCCPDCVASKSKNHGTVGRYRLLQQLGQGGMGAVYLAWNQDSCRLGALKKIILPKPDSRAAQRFLREMKIMTGLDHPNLIKIFHDGIDGDSPYFVCEYADAGCLSNLIRKQKKMTITQALPVIFDVLDGLEYFHHSGHIHRDLKPSNILLKSDTSDGKITAKIADFGLSRSYVNMGGARLTRTGEFAGSLYYTPPEQIVNFARVGPTADIYSVGVTLYEMLCGSLPYNFGPCRDEKSFKDSLLTVLEDNITPIRQRDPAIPEPLAAIVEKAIDKDPNQRYASAKSFKLALSEHIKAMP